MFWITYPRLTLGVAILYTFVSFAVVACFAHSRDNAAVAPILA
jgi:hypothetical protein